MTTYLLIGVGCALYVLENLYDKQQTLISILIGIIVGCGVVFLWPLIALLALVAFLNHIFGPSYIDD